MPHGAQGSCRMQFTSAPTGNQIYSRYTVSPFQELEEPGYVAFHFTAVPQDCFFSPVNELLGFGYLCACFVIHAIHFMILSLSNCNMKSVLNKDDC